MSCCGGLNAAFAVPVPISNGDGPAVDLGTLIGERTFTCEGAYTGRYSLMGSMDGLSFVPFMLFDAGAGSQRRQVSFHNVRFVRVRRQATATVVINVASQLTCPCPAP